MSHMFRNHWKSTAAAGPITTAPTPAPPAAVPITPLLRPPRLISPPSFTYR